MVSDILLKECECAVITSPASLYYLTGFDQSDAILLVTEAAQYYITNPLYEVAVKTALRDGFIVKILGKGEIKAFLRSALSSVKSVGIECDHVTLSLYREILGGIDARVVDLTSVLAEIRSVKPDDEIYIIKHAEGIVDQTYQSVLPLLMPGVSEKEIKDELLFRMLRYGAEGAAFDTIVAFGENAAMPHAVSSDRKLRQGDCILMDFGAKYKGYCSDFTRTVCCGEPTEKFRSAYAVVLEAQRAAIRYLEEGGRSAREADAAARKVIDDSEFRGLFNHTLGHGVGIEIHEVPYLSKRSEDTLRDHSVFTLEPGIYVENEFGIRIESLAVLENGKLTVIDRSDKEIYIV